ncbi:Cell growth-regulating nucleolar protein [Trichostrongylus colubriformis]|uniref:Cell growth-regulating nucleolar protein n=1 Tax=Trichostrongylus colubriformis TaxID=6319 RepID=A0AAN8ISD3_TRICO
MVFFACDQCGESLKKNQVEKHTYKCRSQSYSCIDCQVCFTPYTYQQHIKCITENQKYGSKSYVEKEAKGEVKQNAWCEQVQRAIEFVKDRNLRSLLQRIQGYSNIPRKEAKFINFLTNSCRIRDQALCRLAWKAIADEAKKLKKEQEASKAAEKIEDRLTILEGSTPSTGGRENGSNGTVEHNNNVEAAATVSFKWKSTIKRKLREAGGEMKVKKLRKEVVNAYKEVVGDAEGAEELFESKLAKSGVTVNGKLVSLQS